MPNNIVEERIEEPVPSWQIGFQAVCNEPWWTPSGFAGFAQHRMDSFRRRLCLAEISGSVGDFGVLIPLLAACAKGGSVRLGPAMFWMGVFNIVSAIQWDIPMPVQPMKSIAAVAISDGMSPGAFAAAGIITGGAVWILGVTQMIEAVNKLIPKSVISGMQVGLGINMAAKGCSYWNEHGWIDNIDGKLTCLICLVSTMFMVTRTKLPAALVVFVAGLIVTFFRMMTLDDAKLEIKFLELPVIVPSRQDWVAGLTEGAIPQLPLTILNSVVSVCALSVDLFRAEEAGGKSVKRVSVASSVGLINVVGCWFGAMPSCHGAGGLAGQYLFGARGGMAILILGVFKISIALALGQSLDTIIMHYPGTVLGVLLLFAGVELASIGAKVLLKTPKNVEANLVPCFITAAAYIGSKNMALGVSAGLIASATQHVESCRELKALMLGADFSAEQARATQEVDESARIVATEEAPTLQTPVPWTVGAEARSL